MVQTDITFWIGIIDGFYLLKAQQIAVPGPLDGHKPPLPICRGALWGAEKAKRNAKLKGWRWSPIVGWLNQQNLWLEIFGWKLFRFLKSWFVSEMAAHSLTNQCLGWKERDQQKTRSHSLLEKSMVLVTVDEKQVANQLRWEIVKQFDIDNIIGLIRFREFMYLLWYWLGSHWICVSITVDVLARQS